MNRGEVGSNNAESGWSAVLWRGSCERLRHEMPEDEEAAGDGGRDTQTLGMHGAS